MKELGPPQAYVPTPPPVKLRVLPAQMTGMLLLAVATGLTLTVTEVVAVEVQLLVLVTIRV